MSVNVNKIRRKISILYIDEVEESFIKKFRRFLFRGDHHKNMISWRDQLN